MRGCPLSKTSNTVGHGHQDLTASSYIPNKAEDWESVTAAMESIYDRALVRVREVITWYQSDKNSKRIWSRGLRIFGLVFAAVGGLVPLIAAVVPQVPASWGYVLLAVGAATVAIDQFFGFSTGWIRDMKTIASLQIRVATFQFDWAATYVERKGPENGLVSTRLDLLRSFALDVEEFVGDETQKWSMYFNKGLEDASRLFGTPAKGNSGPLPPSEL